MPYDNAGGPRHDGRTADEPSDRFVFHGALPWAIRSLDDAELRVLLIALLQEWRDRAELAQGPR